MAVTVKLVKFPLQTLPPSYSLGFNGLYCATIAGAPAAPAAPPLNVWAYTTALAPATSGTTYRKVTFSDTADPKYPNGPFKLYGPNVTIVTFFSSRPLAGEQLVLNVEDHQLSASYNASGTLTYASDTIIGTAAPTINLAVIFPPITGPTFSTTYAQGTPVPIQNPGAGARRNLSFEIVGNYYWAGKTQGNRLGVVDEFIWQFPGAFTVTAYLYKPFPCLNELEIWVMDGGYESNHVNQKFAASGSVPFGIIGPTNGQAFTISARQHLYVTTENGIIHYSSNQIDFAVTCTYPPNP